MPRTRVRESNIEDISFLAEAEFNEFFQAVVITGTPTDTTVVQSFADFFPGQGLIDGAGSVTVITGSNFVTVSGAAGGGGLNNVVEDTTPELGGNLDALTRDITNVGALTAVTGTFTGGLTIGTGSVDITTDGIVAPSGVFRTKVLIPNGTTADPGLAFESATNTGLRSTGSNMFLVNQGFTKIQLSTGAITMADNVLAIDGAAAGPSYAFTNSSQTGMYRAASNEIGFSIGNSNALTLAAGSATFQLRVRAIDGNLGNPGFAFTDDTSVPTPNSK